MNSFIAQVDSQHPWIGLASFTEGDSDFFAGRGDEVEQLLRLVQRDTLTLLYGISGLGKTSLLQAGLFPRLRDENYLPVRIRLDFLEGAAPLGKQVLEAIGVAAAEARGDAPQSRPGETLWEYFHRVDNHFWSARNDLITPFLAFDQFEEFFTLGRETADRMQRGLQFITELADLAENRPPAALRDDPARTKQFNFKPVPLSILLSMREDYLGDLDYIRSKFRALAQNRLRLRPMGEQQSRQVIALGASLLAPGAADRILKYVAGAGGNGDGTEITVAPALLSLVLRELNERRLRGGPDAKITADLLDVEQEKILEDFYLETLKDFPVGVRTFVEDKLLTASGHRNSCALDDALTKPDVTQSGLDKLVDRRLLAYEDRHHMRRVEVSHDVLLPVIKASRDIRLTSEARAEAERLRARQAAERRKQQLTAAVACALALALVATVCGGYYFFFQEHKDYYREFAKNDGFPVGIGKISESEARMRRVSFLLCHKGVRRLRWKPAFRVVAVDQLLKPTTNHKVGTYLWADKFESGGLQDYESWKKGWQLGLKNVCQWEFVSTATGEIICERGLDPNGHMMYGLVYSPGESGRVTENRLAYFVGPDGFPQLQRKSAADYVKIYYDKQGWEDRIMYLDAEKRAALGPNEAYGRRYSHNNLGQITLIFSLDADQHNMIDHDGNSGIKFQYDKRGNETEETYVGLDEKPTLLQGFATTRRTYDARGNLTRETYHGVDGEPVVLQMGYHGMEAQYDERGNQIEKTYLGLDGKPTLGANGYATMKSTYDELGNPIAITYLGLNEKPTLLADGYAMLKRTYDARGKITRESYYGVNEESVISRTKRYHGCETQYDELGNPIAITYLGLDEKPTLLQGFATTRRTYDARGNQTRETYHGVDDEPVVLQMRYHGWKARYDERGKKVAMTYLGMDGKPTLGTNGYATVKSSYDERGRETGQSYQGVNGEPILLKDGYHGWEAQYDERENQIEKTYLGLDQKPILLADGYATLKRTYDERGKITRESYYGVNEEPVISRTKGYHGWEAQYDDRGHQIAITYIGADGKPRR